MLSGVLRVYLLLCVFLSLVTHSVAGEAVEKSPVPGWVEVADVSPPDKDAVAEGSVRYVLADVQVHLEGRSSYYAFVDKIVSEAGVEEFSQISADFQPAYQTLVWHKLEVIRDGVAQDRLAAAEFAVIRREAGLEKQLYDGELTAHVILQDIRPGDMISYSYTIAGENPIFAGHVSRWEQAAFAVPVDRVRRSFIWNPEARNLAWQVLGGELKLKEEVLGGGMKKVSYDAVKVGKWEVERNTPDWFVDYPFIEVADYGFWGGFGKWAIGIYGVAGDKKHNPRAPVAEEQPFYGMTEALLPELVKVCEEIRCGTGVGEYDEPREDCEESAGSWDFRSFDCAFAAGRETVLPGSDAGFPRRQAGGSLFAGLWSRVCGARWGGCAECGGSGRGGTFPDGYQGEFHDSGSER